jgi:hypothetical protein
VKCLLFPTKRRNLYEITSMCVQRDLHCIIRNSIWCLWWLVRWFMSLRQSCQQDRCSRILWSNSWLFRLPCLIFWSLSALPKGDVGGQFEIGFVHTCSQFFLVTQHLTFWNSKKCIVLGLSSGWRSLISTDIFLVVVRQEKRVQCHSIGMCRMQWFHCRSQVLTIA